MLVLTRKPNESIVIDHSIEVVVLEVRSNRVRLGFRCPGIVSIRREELDRRPEAVLPAVEELDICA